MKSAYAWIMEESNKHCADHWPWLYAKTSTHTFGQIENFPQDVDLFWIRGILEQQLFGL